MTASVTCQCGKKFRVSAELAGRRVKCPACHNPIVIPASLKSPQQLERITVTCTCGQKLSAKAELAGKRVACPKCKTPLNIPSANDMSSMRSDLQKPVAEPVTPPADDFWDEIGSIGVAPPQDVPRVQSSDADVLSQFQASGASDAPFREDPKHRQFRKGATIQQKLIIIGVMVGIGALFGILLGMPSEDRLTAIPVMTVIVSLLFLGMAGVWLCFEKAGLPGWYSLIPIMNLLYLHDIANVPRWWVLLYLVPLANYVVIFIVYYGVARNFGKGVLYAIGLIFAGFVFFPLLGFGDTEYIG